MSILTDISENLQRGKAKIVKELVQQAIDEGIPVQQILDVIFCERKEWIGIEERSSA